MTANTAGTAGGTGSAAESGVPEAGDGAASDTPLEGGSGAGASPATALAAGRAAAAASGAVVNEGTAGDMPSVPDAPGVSAEDVQALAEAYRADTDLADELRAGFREVKRAPAEAKRLAVLLKGLTRSHEAEGRQATGEITRLVAAIQRASGTSGS